MLPDFFIVGAQKSGTTAVCSILSNHPQVVFSVPKEPMYFSRDDVLVHTHFFFERNDDWALYNWEARKSNILEKYSTALRENKTGKIYGEGSTTYLVSKKTAGRIASILPNAKIICILRNPVDRAYSAYWHYLSRGEVSKNFLTHLRFEGYPILSMGLYKEQISRYLNVFNRDQMYFSVFEEFISDKQNFMDRLCYFLNIDKLKLNVGTRVRRNKSKAPLFYNLQLFLNLLGKNAGAKFSAEDQKGLFIVNDFPFLKKYYLYLIFKLTKLNLRKSTYKPMPSETRKMLTEYYSKENKGLGNMIDIKLDQYWGKSFI